MSTDNRQREVNSLLNDGERSADASIRRPERQPKDGEEDLSLEHRLPTPPDGGWGWVVVLSSFMIHVIADGVSYSFGVFLEDLTLYFDTGHGTTSLLGSLMIGVTWGSGPIVSALTNMFGCRVTTIIGAFVASLGFIMSIFAPNIFFMYFSFGIVAGLGLGLIYVPAIVSVTFYFEKRRSFATGLAVCGSGIGTFIFGPLTELLMHHYGSWKAAVLIEAGLLLNCVVCGALFRPLEATTTPRTPPVSRLAPSEPDGETVETPLSEAGQCNGQLSDTGASPTPTPTAQRGHVYERSLSAVSLPHNITLHARPGNKGSLPRQQVQDFSSDFWIDKAGSGTPATTRDRRHQHHHHHHHHHHLGPLSRKDIFYSGSLKNIPLYNIDHDEYTRSITSIHSRVSAVDDDDVDGGGGGLFGCRRTLRRLCSCGSMSWREILDFTVFKDVVFILFLISNFLTSLGFCIPYVFLPDRAKLLGSSRKQGAFLISVIGISNTVGRVVFGFLSDRKGVNRLMLYCTVLTLCGVSTIASSLCVTFPLLAVYAGLFGCFVGVYVSITSVVLVDLMGLDKLTSSFGLTLMFQGIAAVLGPPIAGWVFDATQNYDLSFYLTGAMIAASGLMLYPVEYIMKHTRRSADDKMVADGGSLEKKQMGGHLKVAKVILDDDIEV